jgi:hypothetical protein
MTACVVLSVAIGTLWGVCGVLGIPPFFMGEMRLPPCDNPEQGIVLRLSSVSTPSQTVLLDADWVSDTLTRRVRTAPLF